MATEQVMQWINKDIHLTQVIHSFETDFSNGYLFGEILCQFGIYDDIKMFSKGTNKEAKVNNFYLIEDAMRLLKVRFDGKMTHSIMQEDRGAALRLLYQLKLAIQRRQGPQPGSMEAMTMTGLRTGSLMRKMQQNTRITQELAPKITKPSTCNGDRRTSKQKKLDNQMVRFQVKKKNLFDTAVAQDEGEKTLIRSIQQRKRAENRQKLRDNQEFMKEWQDEGHANWKTNQEIRQANIAKSKYYDDREVAVYKEKLNRELNQATNELTGGVDEFEKNLKKLGIEQNVNIDDAIKKIQEKKGIPPGQIQNFSFPATMNKIKETKKQSDFAGKERERRRRKLAVDQAKTQARLDKQKTEDQLVQKLLEQQQGEQDNVYATRRLARCKQMLTDQRKRRALKVEAERAAKQAEMQNKDRAEAKSRESQRRSEIENQNKEYEDMHKSQKLQKRKLNIEIVSGVVDLVLDMADEVFDLVKEQPGCKMTKAQWRELSGIFVEGKKCSLRFIKKQKFDTDETQQSDEENTIPIKSDSSAVQILSRFAKEPAMSDLFQFISNSGCFNIDQLRADLFFDQSEHLNIDQIIMGSNGKLVSNHELGQIIDDLYQGTEKQYKSLKDIGAISSNRGGQTSELLQMQIEPNGDQDNLTSQKALQDESKSDARQNVSVQQQNQKQQPIRVPSELPLKLTILGRAFSGKKTIARELQSRYGGEKNIKIFNMDEVIKDALEYIMPKKIDEAAALEASKKAKKGKTDEQINVDIFEGKHPEEYKRLAGVMKAQFFTDYESVDNLPQKIDLTNIVFDDELLVNLFIERLKLAYEGSETLQQDKELEEGIRREKEILDQLAEMDETYQSVGENDKGKKAAGKPAAKGANKGAVNSDEVLREELEQIRKLQPQGWILVDFPRNLTQMKLLESALSGYIPSYDKVKPESQQVFEAWTKVASPPGRVPASATGEFKAIDSGLDGVLIMNTPDSECARRSKNRKIDTQTSIIYHMETEAPEEQKVLDRLQEYTDEAGAADRMQKISTSFSQSITAIKQWLTRFGLKSTPDMDSFNNQAPCQVQLDMEIDASKSIEEQKLATMMSRSQEKSNEELLQESASIGAVEDPWKNKKAVLDTVLTKVEKVIEFRQLQLNAKRESLKQEMLEREERARKAAEQAEEEAAQAKAKEEEEQKASLANQRKSQEESATGKSQGAIVVELNDPTGSIGDAQASKGPSVAKVSIEVVDKEDQNLVNIPKLEKKHTENAQGLNTINSSHKPLSENMQSVGGTSRSIGRSTRLIQSRITELNDRQKVLKLEEMLVSYFSNGLHGFNAMRNLRQRVCRSLNETQSKFVRYLERQSDQQKRINEYCVNYNRFSKEFPDLIGNPDTERELMSRITMLSNSLWQSIKMRKDEAMQERQGYMEGGWVQLEMIKLCSQIARLIENEFRRFTTISAVVTGHLINEDLDLQEVAKRLTERGVEPYIVDANKAQKSEEQQIGHSPQLTEIASTVLGKLDALFAEQHVLSLDEKILKVLNTERSNFSMRLNLLFTWALLLLNEIYCQSLQVFDEMDDWVVIAVKRENQACQAAVKELQASVKKGELHLEPVLLQQMELQNYIQRIEFYDGPPQYMADAGPVFTIDQVRFPLDSLSSLYRQFRHYQEDVKLIDATTFQSLILQNLQAQPAIFPNVWRYLPFEAVINLSSQLEAQPLTDSMSDPRSLNLFNRKTHSTESIEQGSDSRKFVDWRKAFLIFSLMGGRIPFDSETSKYISELRDQADKCKDKQLDKVSFTKVKAWFDNFESMTIPNKSIHASSRAAIVANISKSSNVSPVSYGHRSSEYAQITSDKQLLSIDASLNDEDEDSDDQSDESRLNSIKELIFDVYRVQNRDIMMLEDFIKDINFVFAVKRESQEDERTLYQTMLKMT